MEFFKKAIQISKALAYTNILSPNSIFKASIFGQREGPLDVECLTHAHTHTRARAHTHTHTHTHTHSDVTFKNRPLQGFSCGDGRRTCALSGWRTFPTSRDTFFSCIKFALSI